MKVRPFFKFFFCGNDKEEESTEGLGPDWALLKNS